MEKLISFKTKFTGEGIADIVDNLSKKYNVLLRLYLSEDNFIKAFVSLDKKNYVAIPIDYSACDGFITNPLVQIEEYLKNELKTH